MLVDIVGILGKFGAKKLMNLLFLSIWQTSNRSAKRLLIVSTNLDGFILINYR